jgi:hypothetical protein
MTSQRECRKSFVALVHSLVAAGLVFGMTGVASAQSCSDAKDCYNKKGLKRSEVMNLSTKLRECLRNNQKVQAYDRSAIPNYYLEVIKEQDNKEKQEMKQVGSDAQKAKAVHSNGLAVYTQAAADAQDKLRNYKCAGAPAPAAQPAPAAAPAPAPAPAAKPAPAPAPAPAAKPTPAPAPATAPAPAAKPAAAPAPAAQKLIKVVKAEYGVNCKAKNPNVIAHIASACNGKPTCNYQINHTLIGDTAPGCAKNYNVAWECGTPGQGRANGVQPEASGKTVALTCN